MALDRASLIARYPEFTSSPAGQVAAAIEDAQTYCSARVWGNRYEAGVLLMAAHLIAISPGGESMRLDKETSEETAYLQRFNDMMMRLPIRMLVT